MRRLAALCAFAALSSASAQTYVTLYQSGPVLAGRPVQFVLEVYNPGKTPAKLSRIRKDYVTCPPFKLFDKAGGPPRIERYFAADCDTGETVTIAPGQRRRFGVKLPWSDLVPGAYTAFLEIPVNGKQQSIRADMNIGPGAFVSTKGAKVSLSIPDGAAGWTLDDKTNHFTFVTVLNPSATAIQYTCRSHGGPVVRLIPASSERPYEVTALPLEGAPTCQRLGQTLTFEPGKKYVYRAPLGTHLTPDRYRALVFWRVEGGTSAILRSPQQPAFTVRPAPPVPPLPEQVRKALQEAVQATGVRVFAGSVQRGQLVLSVEDEAARNAILREVRRRALPERLLRIEVAAPVRLPTAPPAGVRTSLGVTRQGGTYTFALRVTNTGRQPLTAFGRVCHLALVERVEGDARVWQTGNEICADRGWGFQLAPGESHTERLTWDGRDGGRQQVPSGTYRVRMAVAGLVGEATFEVAR